MDILDRSSAPLTGEEWERLDEAVVKTARNMLVGRKMIEVLGPIGPGVYSMPYATFSGRKSAGIDMIGDREDLIVEADRRITVNLPMIFKDFKIFWRDVEADRHQGLPLDVSTAAVAAAEVAVQEDDLIFNGHEKLGHQGLLNAEGRLSVGLGNWEEGGGALADAVQAVNALTTAGHYGPYAMAVNPFLYGQTVRVYGNTGMLELDQVKALLRGNIYPSAAIKERRAVVVATGMQNLNLAIGQDLITAYTAAESMNHLFRVFETLALLVRRADAICTIE
ncbi:MAG: bacteriocin family protein [Desulfuromonadales bacterium]|nr:bacteriocin family protein [Desulfuromonadales bacterium]